MPNRFRLLWSVSAVVLLIAGCSSQDPASPTETSSAPSSSVAEKTTTKQPSPAPLVSGQLNYTDAAGYKFAVTATVGKVSVTSVIQNATPGHTDVAQLTDVWVTLVNMDPQRSAPVPAELASFDALLLLPSDASTCAHVGLSSTEYLGITRGPDFKDPAGATYCSIATAMFDFGTFPMQPGASIKTQNVVRNMALMEVPESDAPAVMEEIKNPSFVLVTGAFGPPDPCQLDATSGYAIAVSSPPLTC